MGGFFNSGINTADMWMQSNDLKLSLVHRLETAIMSLGVDDSMVITGVFVCDYIESCQHDGYEKACYFFGPTTVSLPAVFSWIFA